VTSAILVTTIYGRIARVFALLRQIEQERALRRIPVHVVACGYGAAAADTFASAPATACVQDCLFFRDLIGPFGALRAGLANWPADVTCVLDDDMVLTRYSNVPGLLEAARTTTTVGYSVKTVSRAHETAASFSTRDLERVSTTGPLVGTGPVAMNARACAAVAETPDNDQLFGIATALGIASTVTPVRFSRFSLTAHPVHQDGVQAWGACPGRQQPDARVFISGAPRRYCWPSISNSEPYQFRA
jgi:hypothetical protein